MNASINAGVPAMAQQARELARLGRTSEAALVWERVLASAPDHTEALLSLSTQALARRDATAALRMLEHAAVGAPKDPMVQVYTAVALKDLGRPAEEMAALDRALAIDPQFYPALLHKGMLLERLGKRRRAARVFNEVLNLMPDPARESPQFRKAAEHARTSVDENRQSLEAHLHSMLAGLRSRHSSARLERFEETLGVLTGAKRRYAPDPVMLHFAQLPPLQFYDNDLFPWIPELEAATDDIRRECEVVLAEQRGEFAPFIQYPAGAAAGRWRDLNGSPRWSAYILWQHGQRLDDHCERCPRTAAVVESLPLARTPGFWPNVHLATLDARTTLPPHTGDTNARLLVHLPLLLPPGSGVRVGNDNREWQYGKALVFDGSVEHDLRNEGDGAFAELVFDIWNPYLTDAEQDLVGGLLAGVRDYYRVED